MFLPKRLRCNSERLAMIINYYCVRIYKDFGFDSMIANDESYKQNSVSSNHFLLYLPN